MSDDSTGSRYVDEVVERILANPVRRTKNAVNEELKRLAPLLNGSGTPPIVQTIWNIIYGRIEDARMRLAKRRYHIKLGWSITAGYYGLPDEELVTLNKAVARLTRRETEALGAIFEYEKLRQPRPFNWEPHLYGHS